MRNLFILICFSVLTLSCTQQKSSSNIQDASAQAVNLEEKANYNAKTVFASGCFWCVEGVFESVKGVGDVISGYAGGRTSNPTYNEVGSGSTGHAEAVLVPYDSSIVDYPTLLKVYFNSMDPTQVNGQGPDHGTPYRSIIFYQNDQERKFAEDMIKKLDASGEYSRPISVEVKKFEKFWNAEDYHQDYVQKHPNDNPYVLHESIPRIKRFQRLFPELIKPARNLVK
ncbi:MAG: peptide-methionine (S)-S-oxide reductase MsrA [Saprospiraceae bacterium]|nr:peptide-methionine (S)-S-oxide reductase MsrA [Saprospiraceae bacterium]